MSANVGDAVYAILTDYGPIADLLATGNADLPYRISPIDIPQDASRPWIVYRQVSGVPVNSLSGDSGAIDHLVQIDCYSLNYREAVALGDHVRLAFANIRSEFRGTALVMSANVRGMQDLPEGPEVRGSATVIHVRSVDVQIWLGVAQV